MKHKRMQGHDYRGKGFYFITFSTSPRRNTLSTIPDGRIHLLPEGEAVAEAARQIHIDDPTYRLQHLAVMPDHVHAIIICTGGASMHLGTIVSRLKGRSRQAIRKLRGQPSLGVWEDGYHDYIAFSQEVFNEFRRYVIDNPMRWQLRHDNPQWFQKHSGISHPRLPSETSWTAFGDQTILDYPWLYPVIISRRLEGAALDKAVAEAVTQARQGAVVIGGFISPGERLVAKALMTVPRARIIYMYPWGLGGYKPRGEAVNRIGTGKTLVLSGFPDNVAPEATRANCLKNNEWAVVAARAGGTE